MPEEAISLAQNTTILHICPVIQMIGLSKDEINVAAATFGTRREECTIARIEKYYRVEAKQGMAGDSDFIAKEFFALRPGLVGDANGFLFVHDIKSITWLTILYECLIFSPK
jgi:hypothetical protein